MTVPSMAGLPFEYLLWESNRSKLLFCQTISNAKTFTNKHSIAKNDFSIFNLFGMLKLP